jgi:formamidopyrimidine-DNA glycosylase
MPELPEVESVRRALNSKLIDAGQEAKFVSLDRSGLKLRFRFPPKFAERLRGRRLETIERRAKYLLFRFGSLTMINHLGMTGSWRPHESRDRLLLHEHVRISFESDGQIISMVYRDPRRFGYFDLLETSAVNSSRWFKHLGPEPLESQAFSAEYLFGLSRRSSAPLKTFLMNQSVVVGVGNIYASEALFIAGIDPRRTPKSLTKKDSERIVEAIREVLSAAIVEGGTTIRDFVGVAGERGGYGQALLVYGRAGESCRRCGGVLVQFKQAGRSTYVCTNCQK